MKSTELRDALRGAYEQIAGKAGLPQWAFKLPATIPFIGDDYPEEGRSQWPRLLIYASAEHQGSVKSDNAPWLADGWPGAGDRHPIAWRGGWPGVPPFTRIGIAPYEDGPLAAAAALLWRWWVADHGVDAPAPDDPVRFTERIAVANLSKFSLPPVGARDTNDDVRSAEGLRDSLAYVRADLRVLRPDLVLIAKALPAAEAVEVTQAAARAGAQVVYTLQGSGQGPAHAKGHLKQLGRAADFDLRAELGDAAHGALIEFQRRNKDLHSPSLTAWFALLRARYEATRADGSSAPRA